MAGLIRAAGGLVWRPVEEPVDPTNTVAAPTEVRVCLVHRPKYRDWSLPKGKLRPGEHPLAAAVREVTEESGVRAVPRSALPSARYWLGETEKTVDFWVMRALAGSSSAAPGDFEVDRVLWLPVGQAAELATHEQDSALLRLWAQSPPVSAVVLLVRHAHAGAREDQPGADALRSLSALGVSDAARLCRLLHLFAPTRLVSASPRRCPQTLAPLAHRTGLPIEVDSVFDETTDDPAAAVARLRQYSDGGVTVVCSQGAVVPPVLARLAAAGEWPSDPHPDRTSNDADQSDDWATAKGDGWLLPYSGPRPLPATRLRTLD